MMIMRLKKLKEKLQYASKNQQFHLLADLDDDIRVCVESVMAELTRHPEKTRDVSAELETLMTLYSDVITQCKENSLRLKSEYMNIKNQGVGAVAYLDVASLYH